MSINLLKAKSKDEVLDSLKKSNKSMYEILHKSSATGFLPGVEYALKNSTDIYDIFIGKSLNAACYHGHYDVVDFLLSKKKTFLSKPKNCLENAVYNDHQKIVKLLLNHGFDVHISNNKCFEIVYSRENWEMFNILKEYSTKSIWPIKIRIYVKKILCIIDSKLDYITEKVNKKINTYFR